MILRPRVPRVRRSSIVLAVVVAALAFPLGVLATHQFSDVPTAASYHDDVDALVNAGVTTGCGDGKYCPNNNVTRGQMAQFLNRLGNLDGNSNPSVDADSIDGLDSTAFVQPLFAVVNADGTLSRGSSGTSSENVTTGSYRVFFPRDVTDCAFVASIGLSGSSGTSAPGFITVVGAAVSTSGVFVTTDDTAGASANLGFHLTVTCEGPATLASSESGPTVSGTDGENQR